MNIVYMDESQDINTTVLAAVIISDRVRIEVDRRINLIVNCLRKCGLQFWQNFEFHAYEIFQREGHWSQITATERKPEKIMREIRRILQELFLPTIVIVVDTRVRNIELICSDLTKKRQGLETSLVDNQTRDDVTDFFGTSKIGPDKQKVLPEPLGELTSLLLGLSNGMIYERKLFDEPTSVRLDRKFVNDLDMLEKALSGLVQFGEALMDKASVVVPFRKGYHPKWYISKDIQMMESYDDYGLQLADYVAYTTRRRWVDHKDTFKGFSVFKKSEIVPHPELKDIHIGLTVLPKQISGFRIR